MKNFLALVLCVCVIWNVYGQNRTATSITVNISALSGNMVPLGSLSANFSYFNNSIENILMEARLELRQNGQVLYSFEPLVYGFPNNSSGSEDIIFDFPGECGFTSGNYDVHLVVNYFRSIGSSIVNSTTIYNSTFLSECQDVAIPELGNTPVDCDITVFENAPYTDPGDCCMAPSITFDVSYVIFFHTYPCAYHVLANILFPNNNTPSYTLSWSNGSTGHSIYHYCGTETYTLTITWQEDGETCTATETITLGPPCENCVYEDPPENPPLDARPGSNNISANIKIFPNPNHGQFKLTIPRLDEVQRIEIRDLLGQLVNIEEENFQKFHPINVSHLNTGAYYLIVRYTDKSIEAQKIIIQQ